MPSVGFGGVSQPASGGNPHPPAWGYHWVLAAPAAPRACPGLGPACCNEVPCSQLWELCPQSHWQAWTCEGCAEHRGGCGGARLAPSSTPSLGDRGWFGVEPELLAQLSRPIVCFAMGWKPRGAILSPVGASPLGCRVGCSPGTGGPLFQVLVCVAKTARCARC